MADHPNAGQPARKYPVAALRQFTTQLFRNAGLAPDEAACLAQSLVLADLRGVSSHGLMRLRTYAERVRRGVVRGGVTPRIVSDTPAFLGVDGANGNGMWVGQQVMDWCIDRARRSGACFATVRNGNHFGIAASFTERAAAQGMIGIAMSNASPTMVPTGGRKPLLGANPLSIAIPAGMRPPLVLDMATSTVAQGKIILAAKEGKKEIPSDWAVDPEGNPTSDPQLALKGAMLPFGGAKGYGLALIIDILCATLSGALTSAHVNSFWKDFENPQNIGFFLGAWNIASVMPPETFSARITALLDEMKGCPPAPGYSEVCYPGEIEHRREQASLREGVLLGPAVAEDLARLGGEYGVMFPASA
ncbi:MAG TPA: Ldh family oxidoreductase [Opitutaceae bacterium]|nr:Ldh family oxidoreductase [Opitutaceae bacterium]